MRRGVCEALLLAVTLSAVVVGASSDLISGTVFVRRIALAGQRSRQLYVELDLVFLDSSSTLVAGDVYDGASSLQVCFSEVRACAPSDDPMTCFPAFDESTKQCRSPDNATISKVTDVRDGLFDTSMKYVYVRMHKTHSVDPAAGNDVAVGMGQVPRWGAFGQVTPLSLSLRNNGYREPPLVTSAAGKFTLVVQASLEEGSPGSVSTNMLSPRTFMLPIVTVPVDDSSGDNGIRPFQLMGYDSDGAGIVSFRDATDSEAGGSADGQPLLVNSNGSVSVKAAYLDANNLEGFFQSTLMIESQGVAAPVDFLVKVCHPGNSNMPPRFVKRLILPGDVVSFTDPEHEYVCYADEPCEFEVAALDLQPGVSSVTSTPTDHLVRIDTSAVPSEHTILPSGRTAAPPFETDWGVGYNYAGVRLKQPTETDIGTKHTFCFQAEDNGVTWENPLVAQDFRSCYSTPHCVVVHIKGRLPTVHSVTKGGPGLATATSLVSKEFPASDGFHGEKRSGEDLYACYGSEVTWTARASDNETSEIVDMSASSSLASFGITVDENVGRPEAGVLNLATLSVRFTLELRQDTSAIRRDSTTLQTSLVPDKQLCFKAVDNQFSRCPDISCGMNNEVEVCYPVRLRAPPVFITNIDKSSTPFGPGFTHPLLTAYVGQQLNFTVRAADPNPEDHVTILILEDPGRPQGSVVLPTQCVDLGVTADNRLNGGTVHSSCSEAFRVFSWTPSPGHEMKNYSVCFIARDSDTFCSGVGSRATGQGFYGNRHCVDIAVMGSTPHWDSATEFTEGAGTNMFLTVGCEQIIFASASDAVYDMQIQLDPTTPLPHGAMIETVSTGRTSSLRLRWTPSRGQEGLVTQLCVTGGTALGVAGDAGAATLSRRCVNLKVRRCKYCTLDGDTLLYKMKEYAIDTNWLRLWAANGNTLDGTAALIDDPDVIEGELSAGQVVNVGPVYRVQEGDTLMSVAARFKTTIKSLLSLNPDVHDAENIPIGQDLCLTPCNA